MIETAVIRMVRGALTDNVTGANAMLTSMPLDGTDARPAPLAKFIDPTADDSAVTQEGLVDWPLVVVTCEQGASVQYTGVRGSMLDVPNLAVSVAIVTRNTVAAAQAWRDTNYHLVACVNALMAGLFASTSNAGTARARPPVSIVRLNRLTYGATSLEVKGGRVTGAIVLDLAVRYTLPAT